MSGRGGIAGNPVLIGAATVLVVLVAVFLSYNANQGLPFVPTYTIKARVPNAANLVVGNEVRIGGARVGAVSGIDAERQRDGTTIAVLDLKLERSVKPLPVDSTVIIRPRSALGLKYVELTRGRAIRGYEDGATMPLTAARPTPVEFDQFINTFDEPTRTASQKNLVGFGDAFAGRGPSLNQAIGALRPLLRDIVPVAQNLSDPNTGLRRFIGSLSDTARIVAPAAESQAQLFVNLDTTFSALSEVKPFIQESISEGPETLDTAIAEFPKQRPFLANTEGLFRELRPGAEALRVAAPDLADALVAGTRTLPKTPPFNRQVADLLQTLQEFSEDPLVPLGIRRLTELANSLNPTLAYLAPAQLQCNYVTLWFRNVSSLLSVGDRNGTWQRFIIIATPQGPNNEGTPSSAPANGPTAENHFHVNAYPNTAAPGQPKECEAGNEPYAVGRTVLGNTPGTQSATTEDTSK
jgi:phospholipid/cholesterol/gamma-HCH transport system substrate-binding protein